MSLSYQESKSMTQDAFFGEFYPRFTVTAIPSKSPYHAVGEKGYSVCVRVIPLFTKCAEDSVHSRAKLRVC